jgi:taurine dioxygenase
MALQHVTRTATVDEVPACVREHGVMLVRGLDLTSQQHVELTRVFGVPDIHPIEKIRLPEQPEVIVLAQAPLAKDAPDDPAGEEPVGAIAWHSDLTYTALPSRGALLYARVVPEEGGVTGWIDTASVYDALPESTKEKIARTRRAPNVRHAESVRVLSSVARG